MDKDRKTALKKAYKETKRTAGVYRIKNEKNGRIFIGSSVDVNSRINRHRAESNLGVEQNREMFADLKEFGIGSFTFDILETLDDDYDSDELLMEDLKLLENMYMEKLDPFYNKK